MQYNPEVQEKFDYERRRKCSPDEPLKTVFDLESKLHFQLDFEEIFTYPGAYYFRCLNDLIVQNNEMMAEELKTRMQTLAEGVEGLEACDEDDAYENIFFFSFDKFITLSPLSLERCPDPLIKTVYSLRRISLYLKLVSSPIAWRLQRSKNFFYLFKYNYEAYERYEEGKEKRCKPRDDQSKYNNFIEISA